MAALRAFQVITLDLHHGRSLARRAFFDNQHRRNVVLNWITAPAILTDQSAPVFLHLDLRTARRANQNLQQVLANGHGFLRPLERVSSDRRLLSLTVSQSAEQGSLKARKRVNRESSIEEEPFLLLTIHALTIDGFS
jgi:hypothetical protein